MKTLIDEICIHAERYSDETAYTFLRDAHPEESISRGEFWQRVLNAASLIREFAASGDRVLLAYPPGIDFVVGLLGCMYAGVTCVPVYPPTLSRKLDRIEAIVADADPSVAIGAADVPDALAGLLPKPDWVDRLRWIQADGKERKNANAPAPDVARLALLQYTSGSTGRPKGVMVTAANLMANVQSIGALFRLSPEQRAVFWLPPYHDMGLIGGILTGLAYGVPTTLMSPASFLRRPVRWLEAITRVGATISGAPNFAYALCNRRLRDEDLERLNLSSWKLAFCGAEPINAAVMREFVERFSECGMDANAIYPCYGLAESTLMVAGGNRGGGMKTCVVDAASMETVGQAAAPSTVSRSREIVGCGPPLAGHEVRIVDPNTCCEVPTGSIGEIWLRGPSVAAGYWGKPQETATTFHARLVDDLPDRPYLRTGDLGFFKEEHGSELFLAGRIKDIVIVAGRNLYPDDLESTASQCHELLRERKAAAFAVERGVVLVHEVDMRAIPEDLDVARRAVGRALFDAHGVNAHRVVFVSPNSIPTTTSGKVQRSECRARFIEASLKELGVRAQSAS